MKLAVSTIAPDIDKNMPVSLLDGSFQERLEKAVSFGYDGIELVVKYPEKLDTDEIRWDISRLGLEVSAVATGALARQDGLTLLSPNPEIVHRAVERLSALITFAAHVRAPLVTIGSFRGRIDVIPTDAVYRLKEILQSAAEQAARVNVRLVLEPLNRYETDFLHTTMETIGFIKEVNHSHLGMLIDTYHANIEEASMTDCFQLALAENLLWYIHIGDSNRFPPGQGHIDFQKIIDTLRQDGYSGYLTAELLPHPDLDTAARQTAYYLRSILNELNIDRS